jgi:hypothetical protein
VIQGPLTSPASDVDVNVDGDGDGDVVDSLPGPNGGRAPAVMGPLTASTSCPPGVAEGGVPASTARIPTSAGADHRFDEGDPRGDQRV